MPATTATLIQLTFGDKGSYLYAAFGAPIAHEDDARRAVVTALTLQKPPEALDFIDPVQIGISRGTMRAGMYGGTTRHTYGVLGDDVNLAARLMGEAGQGEVLVSGRVHQALTTHFTFEPRAAHPFQGQGRTVAGLRGDGRAGAARHSSTGTDLCPAHGRSSDGAQADRRKDRSWRWQEKGRSSASPRKRAWARAAWRRKPFVWRGAAV